MIPKIAKPPHQIYDEVESRKNEAKAQNRSKWRSRIAELIAYLVLGTAVFVWPFARNNGDVHGFAVLILITPLVPKYFKIWALEDKVEQLEKQIGGED